MTDLLARPTRSLPPSSGPTGPVARPLWLSAGFAGVVASGAMLLACMAVGLVGWFASDAGAHGDTRDAIRVGAVAWLLGHGSGLTLGATTVGVVPLGLTALCGYVVLRLGRWARLTSADEDAPAVALAAVVLAVVYALVALVTALLASTPAAEPGLMPAFTGAFLLALVTGGLGLLHRGDTSWWATRVPETARAVVRGALGIALAVVAAGSVLVTVALALDIGTAASVLSRLHADGAGAALYTLVTAAVAPNAALFGATYLLGPGFAVGTGTVVAPAGVLLGPVPAFPLLAALPAPGPAAGWTSAALGVPALLAVLVGFLTVRRHPTARFERAAVRGLGAGVVGGLLLSAAVALAGGPVGPGRMADVGTPFLDVLAAAVVSLGLGALAGAVATTWWLRRHGLVDDAATQPERDPDTEDTVRL
jgi:hypothetical protein